ncbi:hypothetical protein B0T19DRAFT_399956 [Cercophora scortea]|uniref:Uncharacterized protein n=1 Tax=Cercophora scortea TaxID=314031 RepID=A0AAE0MCU1_9PEZI|nr:hypothetical protein B0T19DRAFT_399956 [Cercophora scortea]
MQTSRRTDKTGSPGNHKSRTGHGEFVEAREHVPNPVRQSAVTVALNRNKKNVAPADVSGFFAPFDLGQADGHRDMHKRRVVSREVTFRVLCEASCDRRELQELTGQRRIPE